MFSSLATHILDLPPWVALLVVFALPALESSAFVGFIFPGEVALILGGVLASQGSVPFVAVIAAGVVGAAAGDSIGYAFGRRYGRRLLDSTLGRFINHRHFDRAETYLAQRGGKAVFFGRFTAALRVMIPGLAGMSGLRYRTFVTYNVASAGIWATMSVLFGYLGGNNWRQVAHLASQIGLAALAAVALVALATYLWHRSRPGHRDDSSSPSSARNGTVSAHAHTPRGVEFPGAVVVIPTYNEADNIAEVITRVRTASPTADILVVDDGSPDGTAHLVATHRDHTRSPSDTQGRVHLLQRTSKDGLGAAYRAGFDWALARGYDDIVQMDADLSHPPESIPALLRSLADGADIAVGSRYVAGGGVSDWSRFRRLISWAGNLYVRLVLALAVHDTTAGFKAFRADALRAVGATESSSNGYCFQVENTWRAVRLGLRVIEVPITFTDRTAGASKMSGAIVGEALSRVLVWRWNEIVYGHRMTGAAVGAAPHPGHDTNPSSGTVTAGRHRGSGHVAA